MNLAEKLKSRDAWLAYGVIAFGLFLLFYAIPNFVNSPSNVPTLVLSPAFWPTIIAGIVIVLGVLLLLSRLFITADPNSDSDVALEMGRDEVAFAWVRLAASAAVMIGLVLATPVLGMVLATAIAFALFAVIVVTPKPVTSIIVAIVLPLVLYAFFAHVAGVSVPQGNFLTLP